MPYNILDRFVYPGKRDTSPASRLIDGPSGQPSCQQRCFRQPADLVSEESEQPHVWFSHLGTADYPGDCHPDLWRAPPAGVRLCCRSNRSDVQKERQWTRRTGRGSGQKRSTASRKNQQRAIADNEGVSTLLS